MRACCSLLTGGDWLTLNPRIDMIIHIELLPTVSSDDQNSHAPKSPPSIHSSLLANSFLMSPSTGITSRVVQYNAALPFNCHNVIRRSITPFHVHSICNLLHSPALPIYPREYPRRTHSTLCIPTAFYCILLNAHYTMYYRLLLRSIQHAVLSRTWV